MVDYDFVENLKCSSTLQPPDERDKDWFEREVRSTSMLFEEVNKGSVPSSGGARPRCASLSLILRNVEGKVDMLVIKRATNPR